MQVSGNESIPSWFACLFAYSIASRWWQDRMSVLQHIPLLHDLLKRRAWAQLCW